MKRELEEFNIIKEGIKNRLKIWVKDKNIPLEERWKTFIDSDLGDHKPFIERFEGMDDENYTDKYYIKRYQTVDVEALYEWGTEDNYDDEEPELNTVEKQNAFKEDVLNKFIKSFEFDW